MSRAPCQPVPPGPDAAATAGALAPPARPGLAATVSVAVLLAAAIATSPASGAAEDRPVDLELVLAVDISRSIDPDEAALQRRGYVAAFTDADVLQAIETGPYGRIAITYVEWAGVETVSQTVAWTEIDGPDAAGAFAAAVAATPMRSGRRTSISGAIDFAAGLFDGNGFAGTRQVIDISGDGPNNDGRMAPLARDEALDRGITINGLPIISVQPGPFGESSLPELDLYFAECVIGGPSSFVIVAESFEDFADAVRRKLILEIAGATPPPAWPAGPGPGIVPAQWDGREAPPCDIGERQWRRMIWEPAR